jgi:hypothetical protein
MDFLTFFQSRDFYLFFQMDKLLAILMATHPRLGADSLLNNDVIVLVADRFNMEVR